MYSQRLFRFFVCALAAALSIATARAQVVVSEIHYHPVEEPVFNATDGAPTYDLSEDVHEFVELQNAGTSAVDLSGWTLSGGIDYAFPAGASIPAGGFKVIAKVPARIEAVYSLAGGSVLGPYGGYLGNSGDTVRVKDASGALVDAVSYDSHFPWTSSPDALGVQERFSGLSNAAYQFKGRSLQRVSAAWPSGDPANWLASPLSGPSPGTAQSVTRAVPKPIVVAQNYAQATDGALIVRASTAATINCTFSATAATSGVTLDTVTLEYFLDDVNSLTETRVAVAMTSLGNGKYTATVPGQVDRSAVRYRIKANRGDGLEVVSPRPDDPQIAPVGTGGARETWWGYFVTPAARTALAYDLLMNTTAAGSGTGVAAYTQMGTNITQNPLRVTAASATGIPRDPAALAANGTTVTATTPLWDGTVPAVFACNGQLWDVQMRYHGSRYHRATNNLSFKLHFPENRPFNDQSSWFITGHGTDFMDAQKLNRLLGLPSSKMRTVSWYFNGNAVLSRNEQGEYGSEMLDAYHELQQQLNPGLAKEENGTLYKAVGNLDPTANSNEGPYTRADVAPIAANAKWSKLQRYDWNFNVQSNSWMGPKPIQDMIEGMWTARGDTYTTHTLADGNAAVKAWFTASFDADSTVTSLALLEWMSIWDDTGHNQFFWRRANGKWSRLGWDYDQVMVNGTGTGGYTQTIFGGEYGAPTVFQGVNWFKDTFYKNYRVEYLAKLWDLNNSFLDKDNLTANGFSTATVTFANNRQAQVNSQINAKLAALGLAQYGTYTKPVRPTNSTPAANATIIGATNLAASAFSHPTGGVTHASTKWEIRTVTGNYEEPVLRTISTTNKTSLPVPFDSLTYGQTYYWRASYIDSQGHTSVVSAETAFTWGSTSNTAGTLVINEVLADNRSSVAFGGGFPDYIELRNNGSTPASVGGYTLTDDPLVPAKYTLPAGTTIEAGGYLLLYGDSDAPTGTELHTGFGLSSDGDQVLLLNGTSIVDSVTFGPQAADVSIGRIVNGTGGWQANKPTPGTANNAATLGATTTLKVNEWMASPASGDDWFELFNPDANPVALTGLYLSDTPGTPLITQIPALSFIAGKGYLRFYADGSTEGGNHANFKLSGSGESVLVTAANGTTIDTITFSAQTTNVSQGRLPDGGAAIASFVSSASPGKSNYAQSAVAINEALTNTANASDTGVELLNTSGNAVDVGGWWLSNDPAALQKYQFPVGSSVAASAYKVVGAAALAGAASPFALNPLGGNLYLSAADGTGALTGYRSQISYGAAPADVPFGRIAVTGGLEFWPVASSTMGAANAAAVTGPIIINEVMYHPVDYTDGSDDSVDEFIELHNMTTSPVGVGGWKLQGDSDYKFPAGTTIRPGDYVLLVSFDPSNAATLGAFQTKYGLTAVTRVYGPYSAKLSNSTQKLELARPATINGASTTVMVDRVHYADNTPWSNKTDGSGNSLQRVSRTVIGNEPANWIATTTTTNAVTPGAVNATQTAIADSDGDGIPDAYEAAHGLDRFDGSDAARDSDGDGFTNLQEYLAGTDPQNAASFFHVDMSVLAGGGGFRVSFAANANTHYAIQWSADLATWNTLLNVPESATAAAVQYDDTTTNTQRFYRVVILGSAARPSSGVSASKAK